jgi:hypothetical protein
MSFAKVFFNTPHRFLKFSCWLPVYFVARLLGITTLLLFPSKVYEQGLTPLPVLAHLE